MKCPRLQDDPKIEFHSSWSFSPTQAQKDQKEQELLDGRRKFALLQEQLENYLGEILKESQDFHALQQELEELNKRKESEYKWNWSIVSDRDNFWTLWPYKSERSKMENS